MVCETYVEVLELRANQFDASDLSERVRGWIKELSVRYPSDSKLLQLARDKREWDKRQRKLVREMERERRQLKQDMSLRGSSKPDQPPSALEALLKPHAWR
jgi:hypothetical protein